MDEAELAAQRPANIDEAIGCMQRTLASYHVRQDRRAFFLHVYLLMTQAVHEAITGTGDFAGQPVFMDPEWVRRLSGRFASHYFESLAISGDDRGRWAWKAAHGAAAEPGSPVLLNVLLGINAHINYDLARAIAENLDPAELDDANALRRRKFDHDQVNNLLNRSIDAIQDTLARDYEPLLALGDHALGGLDERLSQIGLKHYRQQVWDNALTYASALAEDEADAGRRRAELQRAELGRADVERAEVERAELVRAKLDWESKHLAEEILSWGVVWRLERGAARMWGVVGKRPA